MYLQAEEELSALIESTDDLLGSVDLEYRLLTFNQAFARHIERFFGVRPVLGMRPENMLTAGRAALWPPMFQRVLAEGPYRREHVLEDGRTLELSFNPIVVDGKTTGISVFGKDVSKFTEAGKSLRFLANIVESSEDAIFAYGLDGMILTWNRGAETIFGHTAEEAIGKPFTMLVLPGKLEELDQFAQRILQGETLHGRDGFGIRKDGRTLRVSVTSWALKNAEGEMEAVSVIARDVTRQLEAEEAQALLVSIVESSNEAINALSLDGRITSWNPGAERLTGYTREEVIGRHVGMLLPPEDRRDVGSRLDAIKRGQPVDAIEIVVRRRDGSDVDVSLSNSAIRDAQGKITGASAILRDISASKELQSRILLAERKYRKIFDGALEGMFQASFGDKILMANPAFARMLGYDTAEELISSVASIGNDLWADRGEHSAYLKQLREAESVMGFECRLRRKDGTVIWTLVSSRTVRGSDGKALFREGSIQDITDRKRVEASLSESEARYRETFEQAAVGIIQASFEGEILWGNARFAEITGYSSEELPGLSLARIAVPETVARIMTIIEPIMFGALARAEFEKPIIRKDGTLRWTKVTISRKQEAGERPPYLVLFVEDIHARKDAERWLVKAHEELRLSETRYRTVFQTSADAIAINRLKDGIYIDANRAFLDALGFERSEVIGHTSMELGIWEHSDARNEFVRGLNIGGTCRDQEMAFRTKDGTILTCLMSASVIEIDGEPCIVSMTRDVTEAKAAEERFQSLALHDPLTGLPNRRSLLEQLRRWPHPTSSRGRKTALIFVDLDNFKLINDTLGHDVGDLLLQEAARRLTTCVRKYDTVARVGGDEFAVMLGSLSESLEDAAGEARMVGEKIRSLLRDPFRVLGHECHFSSSLGIDVFASEAETAADALQRAEIAMFDAKAAGRNATRFFAPAQQAAVNARAALEEDLRRAVKANEFLVYYQPQIERGQVTGTEALVRWHHRSRGLIQPGEFIAVAEDTGLILQLGELVLEAVCAQLAAWSKHAETAHLTAAVNISAMQLGQPDFVARVMAVLKRAQAPPDRLKLELTESMLSKNTEDTIAKMNELKANGVQFCLDDFGTGYSSLSYLKKLPLSGLKIDRAFVKDLLVDAASGAIAQAIISLGRVLDMTVIAEGVETEEQRGYLAGFGCHSFQGYLYSPALPIVEFERFFEDFTKRHSVRGVEFSPATGVTFDI